MEEMHRRAAAMAQEMGSRMFKSVKRRMAERLKGVAASLLTQWHSNYKDTLVPQLKRDLSAALAKACPQPGLHNGRNSTSEYMRDRMARVIQQAFYSRRKRRRQQEEKAKMQERLKHYTVAMVGVGINDIYREKWLADQEAVDSGVVVSSLPAFLYELLIHRHGEGLEADYRLQEVLKTTMNFAKDSPWVRLFQDFLSEKWDLHTLRFASKAFAAIATVTKSKQACSVDQMLFDRPAQEPGAGRARSDMKGLLEEEPVKEQWRIVRVLTKEEWTAVAFDPDLLGGNPDPERAKHRMERIKRRATAVKETSVEELDPLLTLDQRTSLHMNKERLLPETDLLLALCQEDAELERAFQRRFLEAYFAVSPPGQPAGEEGLSYGQFLNLVDDILSGEVMAAKESVRLWKLSMPRAQERDGLWEQARLGLERIMVGVMHDSSQLRAIFRKHCPPVDINPGQVVCTLYYHIWTPNPRFYSLPGQVVCTLTRDQLHLADGLQDQWNLFQPVVIHHMATLRQAQHEDDAAKIGALHRAVGDVMARQFHDAHAVQVAFRLYQSLLETTYEQVVSLARQTEAGAAGDANAGLKQWDNSRKVLRATENTIKECHVIYHGGRLDALPSCLQNKDAASGKADTIKYIRLMGTALARQAAVVGVLKR